MACADLADKSVRAGEQSTLYSAGSGNPVFRLPKGKSRNCGANPRRSVPKTPRRILCHKATRAPNLPSRPRLPGRRPGGSVVCRNRAAVPTTGPGDHMPRPSYCKKLGPLNSSAILFASCHFPFRGIHGFVSPDSIPLQYPPPRGNSPSDCPKIGPLYRPVRCSPLT